MNPTLEWIGTHMSPQDVWQYGAPFLVAIIVVKGLTVFGKLVDSAIAAFSGISASMNKHEDSDEKRHREVLQALGEIRVKQESFPHAP